MRRLATACVLASLTLVAGCGSDGSDDSAADGSGSAAALTSSAPAATSSAAAATSSSAAATSSSAAATSSSAAATSSSPTVLTGTVGTESDPDAFVITLTDSSGQKVTTLPAGDYTIQVHDLSAQHNFHLTGGSVDEKTSVPEVVDTTFDVTLAAGDYTFKCDPHPPMKGTFTVT